MNRHVPYQSLFDRAKKLASWQEMALWVSALISLFTILIGSIKPLSVYVNVHLALILSNVLTTILALVYIVLEIVVNYSFYKSTREKHLDLIDHAFDEDFTGDRSSGYFNSGNVPAGVYKFAVLTFENSLFTSVIAKKMTVGKWILVVIIGLVLSISAAIGSTIAFNGIAQLALTGAILIQAVRLQIFSNQMTIIHEDFRSLFNALKDKPRSSDEPGKLMRLPLRYVTTLSWGCILLNQKIFDKQNKILSAKWEELKQTYKIG